MNVPVPRRRQDASAASELERLRPAFLRDVDGWPDFPPVGDVFGDVFRDVDAALRDAVPLADVEERDDSYVIDVELPGVRKDDVHVEIAQGRLVVTGERRQRERVGLLRSRTRTTGRFRWDVTLPTAIDGDHVSATLDHGVLTVVVPKAEHARRRRIPIGPGTSEGRAERSPPRRTCSLVCSNRWHAESMAGGMRRGRGPSLADRVRSSADDGRDTRVHHCWVEDAPGHPGRYPGLLVEWRRNRAGAWFGLVAYLMPEDTGRNRLVQRWLPAECLQPRP